MDYFSFSAKNPLFPVASATFSAMHTKFEIVVAPAEESLARQMVKEIHDTITRIESKLNRHDTASLICEVNNKAGGSAVEIDEELYMILEFCRSFYTTTFGFFDISACSSFVADNAGVGAKYLLNPKKHSIIFADSSMVLDFGGFAKGYALNVVSNILEKYETVNALVNFGNSSVLAVGTHPYGKYWPVSVEDTLLNGKGIHTFKLKDCSLSVSGNGRKREHIVNPHTGEKVRKNSLIAVQGQSSLIVEILSTALFAAPKNKQKNIMNNYKSYKAFEIFCQEDGKTKVVRI